jgi:hypothetical protein
MKVFPKKILSSGFLAGPQDNGRKLYRVIGELTIMSNDEEPRNIHYIPIADWVNGKLIKVTNAPLVLNCDDIAPGEEPDNTEKQIIRKKFENVIGVSNIEPIPIERGGRRTPDFIMKFKDKDILLEVKYVNGKNVLAAIKDKLAQMKSYSGSELSLGIIYLVYRNTFECPDFTNVLGAMKYRYFFDDVKTIIRGKNKLVLLSGFLKAEIVGYIDSTPDACGGFCFESENIYNWLSRLDKERVTSEH